MENEGFVSILLQYGGIWDSTGKYVNFKMDAVMYDSRTLYKGLINVIAMQIGVDVNMYELEIKYIINPRCPPICIHNDMGIQVYLDQKKIAVDFFVRYPLSITLHSREMIVDCGVIVEQPEDLTEPISNMSSLYSTGAVRLVGMDTIEVIDALANDESNIIFNISNLFVEAKQVYQNKKILIEMMRHYAMLHKFRFIVLRSSSSCYYLVCPSKNCSWLMNASRVNQSPLFKIRKFCGDHPCSIRDRIYARRQGITDVVVVIILDKFMNPKTIYIPKDIVADMLKMHGITLTYMQAWRAKEKAIKMLRGDPTESYAQLPGYLYILKEVYPESVVSLKRKEDNRFLYAFVALEASIRGWEYCRPVVVVDGAALKNAYRGTILIASTMDPGGHILPLSYAIVDSENDASWTWFFKQFKEAFGEWKNMCFVSDRNESIWNGTARVYPGVEHYACIWHLWCNVVKNFHRNVEDLRKLFFAMAKAYTLQEFEELMGRVDTIDKRIRPYLFEVGYQKWSRAHSRINRSWTLTSNIAESINNVNRLARRLPVVSLLDFMRITIQTWGAKHNSEAAETATDLTKKYSTKLNDNAETSNRMKVIPSTQFLHAVSDGAKRYIVCIRSRRCSCGKFQLDEIPCGHTIAVLRYRILHEEDYCSPYYGTKNFRDAYAIPVEPLPCESTWDVPKYVSEPKLLPPDYKRQVGRPLSVRWKGFTDVKFKRSKVTCSTCGREGHNRKTCSNDPSEK